MFQPNFRSMGFDSFLSFLNSFWVIASKDFLRAFDFLATPKLKEFLRLAC